MVSKNPCRNVGGCFGVTFAGDIRDIAETQTTNMTDELNRAFKKSKIVFK